MMRLCALWLIAGLAPAGFAQVDASRPADPVGWLNRMISSAQQLAFSGTYIHQYANRIETSRVTHLADASGEHEKVVTLDGPVREIIRRNDEVLCYIPETKTVRIERGKTRKFFPALLSAPVESIAENYHIKLGSRDRVAGFECQWIHLEPKDVFRYARRFCSDLLSGLMLKATTLNEKKDVVEQFTFTQVAIGSPVGHDQVQSSYGDKLAGWQTDAAGPGEPKPVDSGWTVKNLPAGYKKVMEVRRIMPNKPNPVTHLVYSDGLASVSVFIEPAQGGGKPSAGPFQQGAYNVFVTAQGEHQVTVVGEAPQAALQLIGNSVAQRGK